MNNMRQIGLGLIGFSIAKNHFPNAGTFIDDPADHGGDPTKSNIDCAITNPASFSAKTNPAHPGFQGGGPAGFAASPWQERS